MIDLKLIKEHCRISTNKDDNLLLTYWAAAQDLVCQETGKTWEELQTIINYAPKIDDKSPICGIELAILMLISGSYENRDSVTTSPTNELPFGVWALIQPYRTYGL
ncbi:MAG: phage gp6-like head-tail connector protein [Neisseriaceae bacterium]|nr:phage gp6-like head-tail connector protein [Neisseriaceae bacterium]